MDVPHENRRPVRSRRWQYALVAFVVGLVAAQFLERTHPPVVTVHVHDIGGCCCDRGGARSGQGSPWLPADPAVPLAPWAPPVVPYRWHRDHTTTVDAPGTIALVTAGGLVAAAVGTRRAR